jgi:hypothetical protein
MNEWLIYFFIVIVVPIIALIRNYLDSKVDSGHNIDNEQVD